VLPFFFTSIATTDGDTRSTAARHGERVGIEQPSSESGDRGATAADEREPDDRNVRVFMGSRH